MRALGTRLGKLEERLMPRAPQPPPFEPEDIEIAGKIMARIYAAPERYADRIALIERLNTEREAVVA